MVFQLNGVFIEDFLFSFELLYQACGHKSFHWHGISWRSSKSIVTAPDWPGNVCQCCHFN